jgi:hypothetical protein
VCHISMENYGCLLFNATRTTLKFLLQLQLWQKKKLKVKTDRFKSSYSNIFVMSECPLTSPSWIWVKLFKTFTLLFNIFLKSTLSYVFWRNSLKYSLNLLVLSFVIGPTRTSNESLNVAWIASMHLMILFMNCLYGKLMRAV